MRVSSPSSSPSPSLGPPLDLHWHVRRATGARPDRRRLRELCGALLGAEGVCEQVELSITLVGEAEIQRLNAEHRGIDRPTDVLSFPLDVPLANLPGLENDFVRPPGVARELGDIVISYPQVLAQAEEYGHGVERELAYLVAHGLLHILGYDHEEPAAQARMRAREEAALAAVGLTRFDPPRSA